MRDHVLVSNHGWFAKAKANVLLEYYKNYNPNDIYYHYYYCYAVLALDLSNSYKQHFILVS